MVDVDTFLTTLYVLVAECDKRALPPEQPTPGPAPALSRSEALTLALFAQWGTFSSERAFYRYAERHLRAAFPTLPTRSQYNRHLRRLTPYLITVGQWVATRLLALLRPPGSCAYEVVDSLGVAVRHNQRRGHGWLPGQAARGWCNRLGWYIGFHLLTVVTPEGLITGFGFAPGNSADAPLADTLLAARHTPQPRLPEAGASTGDGCYLADTGFEGGAGRRAGASSIRRVCSFHLNAARSAAARSIPGPAPCAAPSRAGARSSRVSMTNWSMPWAWDGNAPIPWLGSAPGWPPASPSIIAVAGSIITWIGPYSPSPT